MTLAPEIDLGCAAFTVAGAAVEAHGAGGLWLADERALVVSDLHLEKGSSLAARGVHLPPYDTRATLTRLASLVSTFEPRAVISLGDSFHDADTDARMGADDRAALAALVASTPDWIWIEGNHDPAPPADVGGVAMTELTLGPLTLRHEPTAGPSRGEIAGHLHPVARVKGRARSVRRRCFASDGERLVMPAFGAYAGGLNLCDPAYAGLFETGALTAYVMGRDRVYAVASHRLGPD